MRFNYSKLFRLSLLHNFYADNLLSKVRMRPTKATEKVLTNHGLAWKQFGSDLLVSFDAVDPSAEYMLKELSAAKMKLQFIVDVNDGLFLNYTDLPYTDPETDCYYFSNHTASGKKANNKLVLTSADNVSASEQVRFGGMGLQLGKKVGKNGVEPKIFDIFNVDISQSVLNSSDESDMLVADFSSVGSGVYRVKVSEKEEWRYFASDEEGWSKPFAILEFYFGKTAKADLTLVDEAGKVNPIDFYVQFNARSVYWKYLVMSKHLKELPGLGVANGKSGIVFEGPVKVEVVEGKEAVVFVSKDPIPLRSYKEHKLQLLKGAGKVVMSSLPIPQPQAIKAKVGKPGFFESEMFIY